MTKASTRKITPKILARIDSMRRMASPATRERQSAAPRPLASLIQPDDRADCLFPGGGTAGIRAVAHLGPYRERNVAHRLSHDVEVAFGHRHVNEVELLARGA